MAITLNDQGHKKYLNVDFDDAIVDYSQALNLYPNLAVAHYNRGTVHYRLGDLDPALQDLKRAVHLDPNNPAYREGLHECQRLISETKMKENKA